MCTTKQCARRDTFRCVGQLCVALCRSFYNILRSISSAWNNHSVRTGPTVMVANVSSRDF